MRDLDHYVGVDFARFKAFRSFSIEIRRFNILVGPNNAGKSTIVAAFRILAAAIRKAESRKPDVVRVPEGTTIGHKIDLESISVAGENLFYNYDDDEPAFINFRLATGNSLKLYFLEPGSCILIFDAQGRICDTPSKFKSNFRCPISFVPILGPVEHKEYLFEKEAARLALFNYGAARNFRNIWFHYPENFPEFQELINRTWPGMDVTRPELDTSQGRALLLMWCPEDRRPREIFWAGFGFQVWCQMLTYVIQARNASLFLIDEPDIYLHSDLQRQLLSILRALGPDILIATHSTEIVTEAETDDIVIVDKNRKRASRAKNPARLENVFRSLGSRLNPVLTQLAKTKRVIFVEGSDFQIISRFALKLGFDAVGNRNDFAVVPVEGFNPERIKNLKSGMEATLGMPVSAAAILDRDYRSSIECSKIANDCELFCDFVAIHHCKEIENFLLVPNAIDRAVASRILEKSKRTGVQSAATPTTEDYILKFSNDKRHYIASQYVVSRKRFEKENRTSKFEETITESEFANFEYRWSNQEDRLRMIPGKDALSWVNNELQERFGISITSRLIIEAMYRQEIPAEMIALVKNIDNFIK